MSDDGTDGARPDEQQPLLLSYDFFKFLTTLSLILLGGVLTLASADRVGSTRQMIMVIVFLTLAGLAALIGADNVVRSRLLGRPVPRWTDLLRNVSMGSMGVGTGAFLAMWIEGLT